VSVTPTPCEIVLDGNLGIGKSSLGRAAEIANSVCMFDRIRPLIDVEFLIHAAAKTHHRTIDIQMIERRTVTAHAAFERALDADEIQIVAELRCVKLDRRGKRRATDLT
jgi:hypothetical protein